MTQDEMRRATGLGPDWRLIWCGTDLFPVVHYLCEGLPGPGGTDESEWVRLRYSPTATPGIEVAKCERCRITTVRAVGS